MSFYIDDVIAFARNQERSDTEIASIKGRAREAARDYPGRDGDEFAHNRLNFVLGRELAEKYRAEHNVPA